jgi:excisionase family DNA binding protein
MEKLILTTPEELKQLINEAVLAAFKQGSATNSGAPASAGSKYMTISEAATYLNLAKQTVYGFTSNRTIPFIKRAKRLLFTKADLDEWLEQGKKKSLTQLRGIAGGSFGMAA